MRDNLTLAASPRVATSFADARTLIMTTFNNNHAGYQRAQEQVADLNAVYEGFRQQTAMLGALAFDVHDGMTEAELRAWADDFKRLVAS